MPTLIEVANHLDMSEANASNTFRALGVDWKTASLDQCRVAYIRDIRMKAAGRGGEQTTLAKAKAEEAQVKAALGRLDYHTRLGALVPVADAEAAFVDWAGFANRELMSAVEKLVQLIESEHQIAVDREHVQSIAGPTTERIKGHADRLGRGFVEGVAAVHSAEEGGDGRLADG